MSSRNRVRHARLVNAREEAGLTVKQLARRLGRRASTIEKYEREGVQNHALALSWSRALNCPIEFLL